MAVAVCSAPNRLAEEARAAPAVSELLAEARRSRPAPSPQRKRLILF